MKKLLFAILLLLPCISISQITVTQAPPSKPIDSVSIAAIQVSEIYKGLKRGEYCEAELNDCKATAGKLNDIVQDMNNNLQTAVVETNKLNSEIAAKNQDIIKKEIEIQVLKNKNTPWYRHPITAAIAGFVLGVYIAK